MPQKITNDELLARVDQELRQAQDYMGGKLSVQRRKALQFYMGQAEGELAPPEVEGRSTYVSTDVADTVEWMLPSLLRIFTSSDRVVQCNPRKPGGEQTAEDATDYLNWIFNTQNDGFHCLHTMFKDALISKAGILKVWWEDKIDEAREEYRGLSDQELAQLLEDDEVEPIEHESRPEEQAEKDKRKQLAEMEQQFAQAQAAAQQGNPQAQQALPQMAQQMQAFAAQPAVMVHDVTVTRRKKIAQVRIDPVPPEEFFVSRQAKRIQDAPFAAHVVERTVSDIRAMGYPIEDGELSSDESGMVGRSAERMQRWSFDDSTAPFPNMIEPSNDPSMARVWVCEAYLRADVDGDGIAEWRRVLKVGSKILENVECDGPPFVLVTPVPMPHRLIGLSIADLAMETQKHKTAMIRALQDNLYLQVNGRYFAVEGQVNLDDLLTSRPGGVVRVKSRDAVGPLNQGMADMRDSYQLLEFMEQQKENRTGFSRQSQGLNADALNRTATEAQIVTNRADIRTELIARVFAETGVKDLFIQILKLVCQYQDEKTQFNLNGRWLEVNPREWRHQFDIVVNVGLGTNDPGQKLSQISHLMQIQEKLAQSGMGLVGREEVYNSTAEMVKVLGYKDSDRFVKNPKGAPPPEPQEDPKLALEKLRMQDAAHRYQAEQQAQEAENQRQMQLEQFKQEVQAQQIQQQNEIQAQRDALQFRMESEAKERQTQVEAYQAEQRLAFDQWKVQFENATKVQIAQLQANTSLKQSAMSMIPVDAESDEGPEAVAPLADLVTAINTNMTQLMNQQQQGQAELAQILTRPKTLVRDENGRTIGMQ